MIRGREASCAAICCRHDVTVTKVPGCSYLVWFYVKAMRRRGH